ncbi:MAG: hypothetical protein ACI4S9_08720 [Christensenellales bacterium]
MKFSIERKGYNKNEVEAFINKVLRLTEEKLNEQRARIDELRELNANLVAQIKGLKQKENSIGYALQQANSKAEELESAAKVRYALEMQRLKSFQRRWAEQYNLIRHKYPTDSGLAEFESALFGMEKELGDIMRELNIPYEAGDEYMRFYEEKKNLKVPEPEEVKPEEGFSLAEALTPKETLEDLCKELGLIE